MIVQIRTARIQAGKVAEALAFAKDCCNLANEITGTKTQAFVQIGGKVGSLCWVSESKDLAEYETATAKLAANSAWQKLVQRGPTLFADGETADAVWRSI
jgi:hypothetical protein